MSKFSNLGSADWREQVFASPPVRQVKGRSRPTQRFALKIPALERVVYLEGSAEMCTCILLQLLVNKSLVKRFKEQAFALNEAEHGLRAVPDFLVELTDGSLHCLELKSARFMTEKVLSKLAEVKRVCEVAGIHYHIHTDSDLLCANTQRNLRRLQGTSGEMISVEQLNLLNAFFKGHTSGTVTELVGLGADPKAILNRTYFAQLTFDLKDKFDENTIIYANASCAWVKQLFNVGTTIEDWYANLRVARVSGR